jgi:hypothetical protein
MICSILNYTDYCINQAHPKPKPFCKRSFSLYVLMAQLVDGVITTSVGVFRAGASSPEGDGGGDDDDGMLEDSGCDGLAGEEAEDENSSSDGSDRKVQAYLSLFFYSCAVHSTSRYGCLQSC